MGFWPVVLNVLRNSDVVLLVVDARVPEVARNSEIISKVERMGKKLVLVFNKVDLVGKKRLDDIRGKYELRICTNLHEPDKAFFVSALKKKGVGKLVDFLEEMTEKGERASLRVGVVGYPNAGKSSIINLLVPGAGLKVKNFSGTTRKTEWLRRGRLRIMDSPGVIPSGDDKVSMALTASKDPHKIKNIDRVALSLLGNKDVGDAVRGFYGVEGEDDYEAFLEIGRKKGFLVKGGKVDEGRTAVKIVEDWQGGKIRVN